MSRQSICSIKGTISYIEEHLDEKLDLDTVAGAMHYSKYHLHRTFTAVTGMTIHDYIFRRQLTEAAKLLVFSEKSILDIALSCGYESRQAFTAAFKDMYKLPPAKFRERQEFYPLQLRYVLQETAGNADIKKSDIRFAEEGDIPAWMELVRLVIDGYPHLDEKEYMRDLKERIKQKRALILLWPGLKDRAAGVMAFSYKAGSIDFFGIHPQYRGGSAAKLFLDKLMEEILPGQEICTTTYREGDRADNGHRKALMKLGFAEKELLYEFGYPTQKFVLSSVNEEDCDEKGKQQAGKEF